MGQLQRDRGSKTFINVKFQTEVGLPWKIPHNNSLNLMEKGKSLQLNVEMGL